MLVKVRDLSPKKNTEQNLWRWNGSKGTGGKQRWVPLFPFHLHGGGRIWLTVCLKLDANLNLKHISYAWIHWKASSGESGVPMIIYRHNDLGMRLQKLTASFGLLRSELMNYSQMGVVKFCFTRYNWSNHYCLKVMKYSFCR